MHKKPERRPHTVETVEGNRDVVKVTSGSSGTVYMVVRDGEELICPCPGFQNRRKCSHIDAVLDAATAALREERET